MTIEEVKKIMANIQSIELYEEWTDGEPTLGTTKLLDEIKTIALKELNRLQNKINKETEDE